MLKINTKKFFWSKNEIWFSPLFSNTPQCDYLVFKQCGTEVVDPKLFTSKQEFTTLHIDLTKSTQEIRSKFGKHCRRDIKQGEKLNLDYEINKNADDFIVLLNELIEAKKHTKKITLQEYQLYIPHGDIFTVTEDDNLLCGHFYLKDKTRCRLFWSASKRMTKGLEKKVGLINRWLHWQAIQHYKAEGLKVYDFGGLNLDENSPAYGITKFKMSFGHSIVKEYHYSVINSVSLKIAHRLGLIG